MDKISEKGIETNKRFWSFIKLFMTTSNDINLIDGKNDEYEISNTFNKHYVNVVEKIGGNKTNKIGTTLGSFNDSNVSDKIIQSYQNHQSLFKIKNMFGSDLNIFDFPEIKSC